MNFVMPDFRTNFAIVYVLLGFKRRKGNIILLCSEYTRSFPDFGFLSIEEKSFSEADFEKMSGISFEVFEERFEMEFFLHLVSVDEEFIKFHSHVGLITKELVCSSCKRVMRECDMSSYRQMDHSGICRECFSKSKNK